MDLHITVTAYCHAINYCMLLGHNIQCCVQRLWEFGKRVGCLVVSFFRAAPPGPAWGGKGRMPVCFSCVCVCGCVCVCVCCSIQFELCCSIQFEQKPFEVCCQAAWVRQSSASYPPNNSFTLISPEPNSMHGIPTLLNYILPYVCMYTCMVYRRLYSQPWTQQVNNYILILFFSNLAGATPDMAQHFKHPALKRSKRRPPQARSSVPGVWC